MKTLFALLLIVSILPTGAQARRGGGIVITAQELVYVAPTEIPGNGENLALCHLVKDTSVIFVPVHRSSAGYALAENNCDTDSYYELDSAGLIEAQRLGAIDADIPAIPKLGITWHLLNYAGYAVGGIGIIAILAGLLWRKKGSQKVAGQKVARARKGQLLNAVVDIMCHTALVDGDVDQKEIMAIARVYKSLTNAPLSHDTINSQFAQISGPIDLNNLAAAFQGNERGILLEAAMLVAAADGRIEQAEYDFICDLAAAFGLSRDEVRDVLARLVEHHRAAQAAHPAKDNTGEMQPA